MICTKSNQIIIYFKSQKSDNNIRIISLILAADSIICNPIKRQALNSIILIQLIKKTSNINYNSLQLSLKNAQNYLSHYNPFQDGKNKITFLPKNPCKRDLKPSSDKDLIEFTLFLFQ